MADRLFGIFGRRPAGRADSGGRAPVVFLSYAHDNRAHRDAVRRFRDLLVAAGIEAVLDQFHQKPGRDWMVWAATQIDRSDFVLVIASREYKRRADSPDQLPEDFGRGVWWEANHIRGKLYNAREKGYRWILPVVLPGGSEAYLPNFFRPGRTFYKIRDLSPNSMAKLVRVLWGEAVEPAPAVVEAPPAQSVDAG